MPAAASPLVIEPRFRLHVRRRPFGPGKAELLEHLARTGSIAEAARTMGMSYMRAWTLVKSMEQGFKEPLVHRLRGGSARGGAELTDTGREVLRLYREMESACDQAIRPSAKRLAALVK